jgi:predicted metal-dependent peptidase
LTTAIEELKKPRIAWSNILRQHIGKHCGGRRRTWSRIPKRRINGFGLKGTSHHAVGDAIVVIDTSGSIDTEELKQFFAEIEAMLSRIVVSVLQWDAKFQGYWPKYRRGDWKKIKIRGRGGTDMAAPFQWIIDNGLLPKRGPVILMTDGYTGYYPKSSFPFICVITHEDGSEPDWGKVVRMKS